MKKINFKQPKYIIPLLLLPFFCLFYYVWQDSGSAKKTEHKDVAGMQRTVGEVSDDVKKKELENKLDAYRDTYKEVDGYTAVSPVPREQTSNATFGNTYTEQQKKMLDSIDKALHPKGPARKPELSASDREMAEALKGLSYRRKPPSERPEPKEKAPMDLFKQQMAFMDSLNKANDPTLKAERLKKEAVDKESQRRAAETILKVAKANGESADFNTVWPDKKQVFIMAVIDENLTGYAGSRIRLRLLEDITAGNTLINKGSYIYALINGFSGQRVTLEISSILYDNKILPVRLAVYDMDGLPGLYVPESAFRDFTKDLGTNSIQGVNMDGASNGSQFLMSTASKLFESTSTAIAGMIRKNKAKIKYNSYLYLIDNESLQNAQRSY